MSTATVTEEPPIHIEGQEQIESGMGELERPLRYLSVEQIRPGPNPRRSISEPALVALTTSMERMGGLQTVLVREVAEGDFELIAGERRWLAARRAGRPRVPSMVLAANEEVDEPTRLAMAYAENALREKLTALEEAMLLAGLISRFGFSLEGAAQHITMSRELAEARMALLELPERVRERLASGELTLRNAATLAPIAAKAPGVAEALAERVASGAQSQSALAACVSAIFADQSVLGAAARPNLELPYTLGREEQLQNLAPAALWREAEACLGEDRAEELRPHFTEAEKGAEPARDRLARSEDVSGEALELTPEGSGEEEPDPADD